jgi:hypothetical protein
MNLANFTCKFGDRLVLLDLFDEVVLPAFKGQEVRSFSDASYFLIDVQLRKYDDNEVAIIGRIVKNTILTRDQIFENGKIVKNHAQIDSAPTSFFSLLLSNHKLLYVKENIGAPSLDTFASTMSLFLGSSYKRWTRKIYDERNKVGSITWSKLRSEFPPPKLEITAMGTESSVSAYVKKFSVINTVEIKLVDTNHELDNLPIFGDMRGIQEQVDATDITLKTHKGGDIGLNKGGIARLVASPAQEGNSKIIIRGKGLGGDALIAKNDSFNVSIPIPKMPRNVGAAADVLWNKLSSQESLGIINLKAGGIKAMRKIAAIIREQKWQ